VDPTLTPRSTPRLALLVGVWLLSALVFFTPEVDGPGLDLPGADKVVHVVVFAALTAAAGWCYGVRPAVVACLAGYGLAVEAVQGLLVPGRSASLLDVLADLVGIALALTLWKGARQPSQIRGEGGS
jgi:hypothetical protein